MSDVRIGLFDRFTDAERAFEHLQDSGISEDEIAVLSSNAVRQAYFEKGTNTEAFDHPKAGEVPAAAAAVDLSRGSDTQARSREKREKMSFRQLSERSSNSPRDRLRGYGLSSDLADRYERAIHEGRILMAVAASGDGRTTKLDAAERVFATYAKHGDGGNITNRQ